MSFISIIFCINRRGEIIAITWSVLRDVRRRRKQNRFIGIQECPVFLKSMFSHPRNINDSSSKGASHSLTPTAQVSPSSCHQYKHPHAAPFTDHCSISVLRPDTARWKEQLRGGTKINKFWASSRTWNMRGWLCTTLSYLQGSASGFSMQRLCPYMQKGLREESDSN